MKNVKFIAVMLVLLLGLMGGAYAAWGDELVVSGSVETGTVDVVFTDFEVVYDEEANKKDNAPVAIVDIEYGKICGDDNQKELIFTIENAYPQFEALIEFTVHNQGSIPVKLQSIEIENDCDDALLVENSGRRCPDCGKRLRHCQCPDPDLPEELEVGTQLNTCETAEGSIGIEVSPECQGQQDETYEFTVTYEFIQWNKFVE